MRPGHPHLKSLPSDRPDLWTGEEEQPGEPAWEEPIPLSRRRELPAFPTAALPGWLRDYVDAVAEETQTPVDLAACVALAVLATAAGGRSVVHVRGGWREPTNLFVVVALPPANRKSAVFAAVTGPLYEAEQRLRDARRAEIVEAQLTARLAQSAADKAAAKAAAASGEQRDVLVEEAVGLAQAAEAVTIPAEPQLLADDSTAETVSSLMAEQGGRISVMSAEGGIFDIIAGRYSGAPNMEPFLKGHAGDRLRVNRQSRREYIERPALTMGLSVQPQVLDDIARVRGFDGRGFLARFLYSVPASLVGRRKVVTEPVPEAVAAAYRSKVIDLTLTLADWTDPAVLQLSPEADAALIACQERIEPQLAPRGALGHITKWAGKLAGAVARIAALLHLAEHLEGGHTRPVSEATMQAAITIGQYFTAHALAAFDAMGADPTVDRAHSLLDVLRTHGWREVTRRDLFATLSRSEFPTVADLEPAVQLLAEHGWLREELPARTGRRGRPPAPRYVLHPSLSEDGR
ncbi:YfjI family protein [Streptomyces sp. YIM 98790]|uniref:YfjI family protein n=1 Tax=Streptomyces sp. YIM 98790 TaxID=2689077 RepID=UPI0028BD9F22|nr:YfjI family protein [Streptomyces sp. YIM 98790]